MKNLLINNIKIITMESEESIIERGHIFIKNGIIADIGEGKFIGNHEDADIIDGDGCIAIPGLINCHTHIPMTLMRGYGEGLSLMRWLNEKIWPFEEKMTRDDIIRGTELGIVEMLKTGTTCYSDMYYHEDAIGEVSERLGIRVCLGRAIIGEEWKEQIEETRELKKKFEKSELVDVFIAPHSTYTVKPEAIKAAGDFARKHKIPVHIHMSETNDEINIIKNKYGKSPFELCREFGLFYSNRVLTAHCVHLSELDKKIIGEYNIIPVHCPSSNMKLSSGAADVKGLMNMRVNIVLGTDGASSNNSLNMFGEMKSAALLMNHTAGEANAAKAYEILEMATVNGARAIGKAEHLGKLKSGFKADIVIIDTNTPSMIPCHDVYSNIVFSASGAEVKTVIVGGRIVVNDGSVATVDEKSVYKGAEASVNCVLERVNR